MAPAESAFRIPRSSLHSATAMPWVFADFPVVLGARKHEAARMKNAAWRIFAIVRVTFVTIRAAQDRPHIAAADRESALDVVAGPTRHGFSVGAISSREEMRRVTAGRAVKTTVTGAFYPA
jgi:hypothetical protein